MNVSMKRLIFDGGASEVSMFGLRRKRSVSSVSRSSGSLMITLSRPFSSPSGRTCRLRNRFGGIKCRIGGRLVVFAGLEEGLSDWGGGGFVAFLSLHRSGLTRGSPVRLLLLGAYLRAS